MRKEEELMWIERGILGLIPLSFTLGQLFCLYVNFLYFGEIVLCSGLAWFSAFVGIATLALSTILIFDQLVPLRNELVRQIDKPF